MQRAGNHEAAPYMRFKWRRLCAWAGTVQYGAPLGLVPKRQSAMTLTVQSAILFPQLCKAFEPTRCTCVFPKTGSIRAREP